MISLELILSAQVSHPATESKQRTSLTASIRKELLSAWAAGEKPADEVVERGTTQLAQRNSRQRPRSQQATTSSVARQGTRGQAHVEQPQQKIAGEEEEALRAQVRELTAKNRAQAQQLQDQATAPQLLCCLFECLVTRVCCAGKEAPSGDGQDAK